MAEIMYTYTRNCEERYELYDNWRRRKTKSAMFVGIFRWNLPMGSANFVDSSAQDLIHYAPRKGKKNVY